MKKITCFKCKNNTELKKINNDPETYSCESCGFEHKIDRSSLLSSFEQIRDNELDPSHPVMVWNDVNGNFSIQSKTIRKKITEHVIFDDVKTVKTSFGLSESEDVASAISGLDWQYIIEYMIHHETLETKGAEEKQKEELKK